MKKSVFIVLVFLMAITLNAQTEATTPGSDPVAFNEVKANGLILLFGAIEVVYERNLNAETSAGISVLVPFVDEDDIDWNINYYISPYYRVFFGKNYASGFFVEGFGLLNSKERERYIDNDTLVIEDATDFGLGIGLGAKWVAQNGFVFELNAGLSRNLFNNGDYSSGEITGKIGFNLGYRF